MRASRIPWALAAGAALLLVAATPAQGQALVQEVRIAPGRLHGRILRQGTRTPIDGHALEVSDAAGRVVETLATAGDGGYETAPLAPGTYTLRVAPRLTLKLVVASGAVIQSLDIVVPAAALAALPPPPAPPAAVAPPEPAQAAPAASGGLSLFGLSPAASWGLVAVGAAAIVVPVGIAVAGSDGGSETPISPSRSRLSSGR